MLPQRKDEGKIQGNILIFFFIATEEQHKALSKSFIKIHTLKTGTMDSAKDFCYALSYMAVRGRGKFCRSSMGTALLMHNHMLLNQPSPTHTEC